jgi:hypothetical protein
VPLGDLYIWSATCSYSCANIGIFFFDAGRKVKEEVVILEVVYRETRKREEGVMRISIGWP